MGWWRRYLRHQGLGQAGVHPLGQPSDAHAAAPSRTCAARALTHTSCCRVSCCHGVAGLCSELLEVVCWEPILAPTGIREQVGRLCSCSLPSTDAAFHSMWGRSGPHAAFWYTRACFLNIAVEFPDFNGVKKLNVILSQNNDQNMNSWCED